MIDHEEGYDWGGCVCHLSQKKNRSAMTFVQRNWSPADIWQERRALKNQTNFCLYWLGYLHLSTERLKNGQPKKL